MVPTKKIKDNIDYINKIKILLDKLEIKYVNIEHYLTAFIHKSLVNERPDLSSSHNERLEFLWDAVLELAITKNLYDNYPDLPEWQLTDYRSSLVKWKNLALVWKKLEFDKYLILWRWEELSGWRKNESLLANSVESFIWAVYVDLWFDEAKKMIDKYIYSTLPDIINNNLLKDYKSIFQEEAQRRYFITPSYQVISEEWEDHNKIFTSWVYLNEKLIATWVWPSKRKSQENSAMNAYNLLFKSN